MLIYAPAWNTGGGIFAIGVKMAYSSSAEMLLVVLDLIQLEGAIYGK